MITFFFLSS